MTTRTPAQLIVLCLLFVLGGLLGACSTSSDDDSATVSSPTAAIPAPKTADEAEDTPATTEPESTATAAEATADETNPTPTEAPDGVTPTAGDSTGDSDSETEAKLREVIADTAEVRGLEPKHEVEIAIISRDQLRENMLESLDEDYPVEDAAEDVRILYLMRLLADPDIDLHQLYVDLYSERVLGYYDPEVDELFVVSDGDGLSGLAQLTMAHELVHALQDQYYDLEALRPEEMDADAATAVTALIEGDAETAGTQYALGYMLPAEIADAVAESGTIASDVVDAAPAYIREGLYFPYVQGVAFVNQLYLEGGFERVDEAYADPPTSTEQILHPEKYLEDRDDPVDVTLPDLASTLSDWTNQRDDGMGEFDLEVLLRENGNDDSRAAAAGWGGGQWAYYTRADGADDLVIMGTVWDTDDDAAEFESALRSVLDASGPADSGIWDDGSGRFTAMTTTADGMIVYIAGTDRAAVEAALAAL